MNYLANRPKTIVCDIDGTIIQHNAQPNYNNEIFSLNVGTNFQ